VLHPFFFQMGCSTLRATGTMVRWFIRKCESRHRGILIDIRSKSKGEV